MNRNIKNRILVALMAFAIAVSSISGFAPVEAETALTEEKMKEVLIIVKGKLEVGDEYTEFDYDYNEYSGDGRYQFNWRTEDGQASISASADITGRIYSFSRYDYSKQEQYEGQLPKYISEELIPKAQEWIEKVEPEVKGKLNLKACRYQSYRKNYYISFVRCENGIDLNDNSISVSMDAMDGSVLSYNLNWNFEVSIPKVDQPIGEKAAAEKVGQNVNMELQYRLGYDKEGNPKVYLAYNPDRTYIAVDAKNGKVYTERIYWGSSSEFDGGFNEAEYATADEAEAKEVNGATVRLSDAEIKKIDEIKDIISSEEAVKLIKNNKMLYVDQNLTSANCKLYSNDGEYYWRIYLSDDRPIDYSNTDIYYDYYRASLNASIDAKTGKLISFSANTKDYYYLNDDEVFKASYSKKQCQKLFEDFVKSTESDKYKDVKVANVYDQNVYLYDLSGGAKESNAVGGYSFSYSRYYKDIPFTANGITGAVEAVTGKVTRYNVNWTDAEIPEPENLIGEKKAFDSYISFDGFDLIYELVSKYENKNNYYGYDKEVKARLVYRTAISPNLVDAFTGKQLSWNGEEYKPAGVSFKYTDINGTKYERSIKLLADMGYGLDGEEFKPSDKITNEDFEKILNAYGGNYYYYYDYTDETDDDDNDEVINDNELTVTRQEAASLMIIRMGAGKLAQMDIYKTGYSDEKKIDKENVGAVALCKGLGIMGAKSGTKFKPNSAITRGEAADLVIRMISCTF